jgi:sugar phosphate isomerase/epimerase
MQLDYAVSIWNYTHHVSPRSVEEMIGLVREREMGIELWGAWKHESDLYSEENRLRLKALLEGMKVSLHSALSNSWRQHKKQIDAAAAWGANVVVLHSSDLVTKQGEGLDYGLAREVVTYAAEQQVQIALENGQLPVLAGAIEAVEQLGICLDVGHVYLTNEPMHVFLDVLGQRIIHLHLHDHLAPELIETGAMPDHYALGSGGIPKDDWHLLAGKLREIDFSGMAVFEIRPRSPLQTAHLGSVFMNKLLDLGQDAD